MFDRAKNVVVKDSTLVVNAESSTNPILQPLLDRVSLNAILNAGGRADEVGCYPGTRDMVIGKLERWMDGEGEQDHRMFWLSGPAGAGKSAIMQTVAERCKDRETPTANFFFFRGDGSRNTSQPLVATLVYQLLDFHPSLHEHLKDCLSAKPLTYKASTKEQFAQFISSPFKSIRNSSSVHQPIILIIDGLDECNDSDKKEQEEVLRSLHALVDEDDSPFRVLVASRAEHHLQMSFNKISTSVESIFLDGTYGPEDDIRRFVIAKFDEIKRAHPLSYTLSEDWPAEEDIDAIVSKSSGQFIYAATVIRFIQHSSGSPALSLRAIQGVQASAGNNPLAHLDAYSHIFSKALDLQTIKLFLGLHLIIVNDTVMSSDASAFGKMVNLMGYEAVELVSYFADLVAIVQVTTAPHLALVFYHASLPDFLDSKSRSGSYHVGAGEIATELSLICLKKFHDCKSLDDTMLILSYVHQATPKLSNCLLEATKRQFPTPLPKLADEYMPFYHLASTLERLYFKTDRALFKLLLQSWIRFACIHRIVINGQSSQMSTSARQYYRWYLVIERVKFALGLSR